MSLDLFKVNVGFSSNTIELTRLIPDFTPDLKEMGVQAANQAAIVGLKSFQSVVPVFKRQLRDSHIQIDFANRTKNEARVYVVDQTHDSSPRPTRKGYLSSSALALELDKGIHPFSKKPMQRSQTSNAWPGYYSVSGETADWIEQGYLQTLEQLDNLGLK